MTGLLTDRVDRVIAAKRERYAAWGAKFEERTADNAKMSDVREALADLTDQKEAYAIFLERIDSVGAVALEELGHAITRDRLRLLAMASLIPAIPDDARRWWFEDVFDATERERVVATTMSETANAMIRLGILA
jgi:hypothetical protein